MASLPRWSIRAQCFAIKGSARLFFFGISMISITALSTASLAAFNASFLVLYSPFNSSHGNMSSILIHKIYKLLTVQQMGSEFASTKTVMNLEYILLIKLGLETYLRGITSFCKA